MRPLVVSTFATAFDNRPVRREVSWADVCKVMTRCPVRLDIEERRRELHEHVHQVVDRWRRGEPDDPRDKTLRALKRAEEDGTRIEVVIESELRRMDRAAKSRLPAWCPAEFEPGRRRSSQATVAVHLAALDYDSGATIEEELERWAGCALVMHTSWSHTGDPDKFRIVLPLARPVPGPMWGRCFAWLEARTDGRIDPQTKNADRLSFKPAIRAPDWPHRAEVREGEWLDIPWEELPDPEEEAKRKAEERRRYWSNRRQGTTYVRDPRRRAWLRRQQLKQDPAERLALGLALGGHEETTRGVIKGVPCPACGKTSVWWAIEPAKNLSAMCEHRNSCGWLGPLDALETPR